MIQVINTATGYKSNHRKPMAAKKAVKHNHADLVLLDGMEICGGYLTALCRYERTGQKDSKLVYFEDKVKRGVYTPRQDRDEFAAGIEQHRQERIAARADEEGQA